MSEYELDDDPKRVDLDAVWAFMSTEAYWGRWRTREQVAAQVDSAWRVVGAYHRETGAQVGLARSISVGATGFRAALDHLAPLGLRGPGGGIVMDGTRVAADPRLHLVGYGPSASTIGANRAGRTAVREIRALLGQRTTTAA